MARHIGLGTMAEVDLGERRHRNRPLSELAPQALSVARVILERAGVHVDSPAPRDPTAPATSFQTTPTNPMDGMQVPAERRIDTSAADGRKLG